MGTLEDVAHHPLLHHPTSSRYLPQTRLLSSLGAWLREASLWRLAWSDSFSLTLRTPVFALCMQCQARVSSWTLSRCARDAVQRATSLPLLSRALLLHQPPRGPAAWMSTCDGTTAPRPIASLLRARLLSAFGADCQVELADESYKHSRGVESHFAAVVVSPAFEGMALLARHRAAMDAAKGGAAELPCHALSLRCQTPAQWAASGARLHTTPPCLGGDRARS